MHKYAVAQKPPEAGGIINGLLAALVSGVNNGEYTNSLSFADARISADPDLAPRGYANPGYTVVPRAEQIDPTSVLAMSSRSAHRRNPVGTVGYTHHHVALEHLSHISSMFAKWITEFNVLYANASLAQQAVNSGSYTRLDSVREARYTDGDIEMFLAAVGRLDDGNISYPASQTIDVDVIYSRVMTQLSHEIGILDNLGFGVGESAARKYIGIGSIPKTGQNVCVLSAGTYDKLCSSPWKRILTIPRARDMVRVQFEERLDAALGEEAGFDANHPYVTITEGDDVLYVPTHLFGARTTWESLVDMIDSRNPLTSGTAQLASAGSDFASENSGKYACTAGGDFNDSWLNQFYDMGDLVETVFADSSNFNVLTENLTCLLLSPPITDPTQPTETILSEVVGSTGALGSYNLIDNNVGLITGGIDVIRNGVGFTGLDSSFSTHCLPNGLMYIGACGEAKATSWIRILRTLRLNFPQEVKLLLQKTGRAKKTLATTPNRIASMDSLLAEVVSNGQRDGYMNVPALAFNVSRLTRDEQEGPLFAGSTMGIANPGTVSATPIVATGANQWDRNDEADGRYIVTPDGSTINFEYATPSRFTGTWDAGRFAVWAPDFVSDSIAMGSGNAEVEITRNLLSYPHAITGDSTVAPRYVPGSRGLPALAGVDDVWSAMVAQSTDLRSYHIMVWSKFDEFEGYGEGIALESYNLSRGFVRGLANVSPNDNNRIGTGAEGPRNADSQAAITGLGRLPLGLSVINGIQTYTAADQMHASVPYSSYGIGDLQAPPVGQWFWDPTRTQCTGTSWHRWAGQLMDGLLPHPYLPHPIAVSTAFCRLADLAVREEPNECNVNVFSNGLPSTQYASMGGASMNYDLSNMSQLLKQGVAPGVVAMNPSTSWKSHVSSHVSEDIVNQPEAHDWTLTGAPAPDTAEVIPAFELCSLIANGCSRVPINRAASHAVLRNRGDTAAGSMAAPSYVGQPLPTQLEGETLTPMANTNGSNLPTRAKSNLIIGGKGLLFEGDLYTQSFLDPMAWLVGTYSGEESMIFSQFSAYWAPYSDAIGWSSVFAPLVGANFNATASQTACLKPATTATGVNLVKNDWFRKGTVLPAKHARMRSGSIVNPWIRGSDGAGIAHLRYDNSQLGPIFAALDRAILEQGRVLQTGLENSLFLEIQVAN